MDAVPTSFTACSSWKNGVDPVVARYERLLEQFWNRELRKPTGWNRVSSYIREPEPPYEK